jgi:hypothetical protein
MDDGRPQKKESLMLGADGAPEFIAFLIIMVTAMVGSVWWLVGYQRRSRTRGWETLQVRFAAVNGRIIQAGALGGLVVAFLPIGLGEILKLMGIKIPDIPVGQQAATLSHWTTGNAGL